MKDHWVRIAVLVMLTAPVAAAWDAERRLDGLFGEPWPGFYVIASAIVAPPASPAAAATMAEVGLTNLDQVLSADGRPLGTANDVWVAATRAGVGAIVHYRVRGPLGEPRDVRVPVRRFTRSDAPPAGAMFTIGLLWLLVGAVPVLARPGLTEARLFFVFSWSMSCNFGFLAVDHLVLHRFQPWSFAVSATAIATLIHMAFTFPQTRRPFRGASPRGLAGAYSIPVVTGTGFAALYLVEPLATYRPALAGFGLYLAGAGALLANILFTLVRPRDASHRRRARVTAFGPALAALLAACLAAFSGWGPRDVGAAAFFGGVGMLPFPIAWATFQQGLFDLDAVMRRGLAVGGAALVVSLGFLAAFSWLSGWLGIETAGASAALALLLLLAAVPLSQPLRRRLQAGVDSLLFPGRAQALASVRRAARSLARVRDRAGVAALVRDAVREALGTEEVHLVAGPRDGALREVAGDGVELAGGDPLAVAVRRGLTVSDPGGAGRAGRTARRALRARSLALLLPLPVEGDRAAALLLGPRAGDRPYGQEERRMLRSLAAQAALALGNAEAWDELTALRVRLQHQNVDLRREIARHHGFEEIVGDAPGIASAREQVAQVARTGATVLVLGETGTGKELIVRALHRLSDRAERPLVRIACAAVPETLLEGELFGHEKGAFTGAHARRVGRFEVADGGTLFLDDVDTLPLAVQAKLLRALQEGEFQRLGSNELRRVDVRTVAATNRDLRAEVAAGRFREDLYYRLHVVPIQLPPLREREGDVPLLVQHFIDTESAKLGRERRPIDADALAALVRYEWPGNVRELRNVIERAVVMSRGEAIRLPGRLGRRGAEGAPAAAPLLDDRPLAERVRAFKAERIRAALAQSDHNLSRAAEALGLHRQSLSRMVRDLGLTERPD